MRPVRVAVVTAGLALVAGCGGGGPGADAPEDASLDAFCAAQSWGNDAGLARLGHRDNLTNESLAELIQDWGHEMARVGTPADIPTDARAGFERVVDRAVKVEPSEAGGHAIDLENGLGGLDELEAFTQYRSDSCP